MSASPEFPDVSEMVDAMRGAVTAADAWSAINPPFEDETPEGQAWVRAFAALRDLVSQIDEASDHAFGGSDA